MKHFNKQKSLIIMGDVLATVLQYIGLQKTHGFNEIDHCIKISIGRIKEKYTRFHK